MRGRFFLFVPIPSGERFQESSHCRGRDISFSYVGRGNFRGRSIGAFDGAFSVLSENDLPIRSARDPQCMHEKETPTRNFWDAHVIVYQ